MRATWVVVGDKDLFGQPCNLISCALAQSLGILSFNNPPSNVNNVNNKHHTSQSSQTSKDFHDLLSSIGVYRIALYKIRPEPDLPDILH